MELSELEHLALGTDRAAALAALLPGTTEHDYWRGVLLQHEGRLDEVDELLRSWGTRHRGHDQHYAKLQRRQLLARARSDLASVADQILEQTGTALDDRAEVVVQAQHYPTSLDPRVLEDENVLRDAVRRRANLEDLTDAIIPDVVRMPALIPGFELVRRTILQRLSRADVPNALELVIADLEDKDGSNGRFGALAIHNQLTLAQLEAVAERLPHVRTQSTWVDAVLARLAPPSWVDVRTDREERGLVIDRAYAFAKDLAAAFNTLKATLLYHRLDLDRATGVYDRARFRAYVELPRHAAWVPRAFLARYSNEQLVQANVPAAASLGLDAIGNDEPLLRDYFSRFLLEDEPSRWSDVLDAAWLEKLAATARLLAGAGGTERLDLLSASEREALKNRVDIELAVQNPPSFDADDDVSLEVDVKNVRELEVKVFRINALAYWLAKNTEIDTSIDLDGMVPSGEERRLRFEHPPIRRHRVRIDLPECKRPGTYVVELIGNGRSSRALLRKGTLRHLVRPTAAGVVVSITDEAGRLLPAARLWLGGRELAPRDPENGGGITVPFATGNTSTPILLVHGDVVQRAVLERPYETPVLTAGFQVERELLVANQTAKILLCPRLTLGGAPASLALLSNAVVLISATTLDGTSTSRTQPVALTDDQDVVIELPIPEGTSRLTLALSAQVRIASRQETIDIADSTVGPLNVIHATESTDSMHLARVASTGGAPDTFVFSLLGKSGEPIAGRAISFAFRHRAVRTELLGTLETDAKGTIDLGPLDGTIQSLTATSNAQQRTWSIARVADRPPHLVHGVEGEPIVLARTLATRSLADLTLMEHRRGKNLADVTAKIALDERCLTIRGLSPGEYRLDFPERTSTFLVVVPAEVQSAPAGAAAASWVRVRDVLYELSRATPLVRHLGVERDHLVLHVSNASPATRVHLVATRFLSDRAVEPSSQVPSTARDPQATTVFKNLASYISGRDIGDEYRYVLERRNAPRRAGIMLEKPSLLLHAWALRTTSTSRIEAAAGGAYAAMAPPPGAPAPAPAAARGAFAGPGGAAQGPSEQPGFTSLDFLPSTATVIANRELDGGGVLRVALSSLGADAQRVQVLVVDPSRPDPILAELTLPASPLRTRDLRLRLALDPAKHFHEQRRIDGVPAGTTLVVPDVRTGKIELVGTLARAHQLLVSRLDDSSALQEFAFITEWPKLDDATKRARYGKFACHELNLFLWRKDHAFFEAAIRPSLAHKREKSVVDRFLLGEDLRPYLEAWAFGRLNTLERILVASAIPDLRVSIARLVGDAVDLLAPDPEGDAQLVATLLGSAALEVGAAAMPLAAPDAVMLFEASHEEADTGAFDAAELPKMKKERSRTMTTRAGGFGGGGNIESLMADLAERERSETLYRGADKTQEWAEVQWWRRRREEIQATLIEPNRFWRDLAKHLVSGNGAPFLSPHIGLCNRSFAEAMCALAFIDLPFVAEPSETTLEDTRFTVTPKSHALAASASLVEIASPAAGASSSVLIGQSYVRSDDRWEWEEGEQREKRVTGELITGVVYRCLVVVTNPTSATEKLEVLLQIPKGAMPVDSGFITRSAPLSLDPYATESFDYAFYFPAPGTFTHFPAHVTKNGLLLAYAPPRELTVMREPQSVDLTSWSHVSQHGTLDEVLGFLEKANLGRTDLARIAWRMHEAEAFRRVTDLLASRHVYDDRLWAYALKHRDPRRTEEWMRHQDDFLRPGTRLDEFVDPTDRAWYQHLEYAPLINARAHRLGAQRRIANSALDAQYRAFLDYTAHRAKLSDDDLLVAAHYLLAMDRVEDAIPVLQRISASAVVAKAQFDYLAAYIACYRGDVPSAKILAGRWLNHPVDRWRNRFLALAQMIDEITTTEKPKAVDADSRDQKLTEAAAREPSLEIAVHGGDITLTHANLAHCQLRFFKLDIELVFSRQPFVQSDVERFSFIEPGLTVDVALSENGATTKVPIPASLRGANIVIEAVAPGLRRSVAHYAHDLGVQVAHAFGQLKVVRASTGAPLSAVYVKVYARERGGRIAFFKDGYTDLRGRFDYATLSTDDLDRTDRFALLIASDDAGATITEAAPPPR